MAPLMKVLWYLPIVPKLKHLFLNKKKTINLLHGMQMRENVTKSFVIQLIQCNGKKINKQFPNFGQECRNLQLGLATNGINPFSSLSTNYCYWPAILFIYNLSPRLCMKRKYMLFSMVISGP